MAVATVDSSIYAPQPGHNALDMIAGMAHAQSAMVNAQSAAMQWRARLAMGPILQHSIGPDGNIDYNRASVLMASNPDTAWMAQDFINQAIQRDYTQQETIKTHLDNAQTKYNAVLNAIQPLTAKGNSVTSKDVMSAGGTLIADGMMTNKEFMGIIGSLPADGQPLAQWVGQRQLQAAGAAKSIETVNSGMNWHDAGGGIVGTRVIPSLGINEQLGTVAKTPTPESLATPMDVVGPDQETRTGARGNLIQLPAGQPGAYTPA